MSRLLTFRKPALGEDILPDAPAVQQVVDVATQTYGLKDFETDIEAMKPRAVDIWVIPPLMMYAAWKSKGSLNKWVRRSLFTAGVYMMYRNYAEYRKAAETLAAMVKSGPQGVV